MAISCPAAFKQEMQILTDPYCLFYSMLEGRSGDAVPERAHQQRVSVTLAIKPFLIF